jgi:adenosine kinase
MSDAVYVCGSVAFDTIAVFDGRFKEHILPDRIHALSVSFLVPQMRREFGGCAGNISYNLTLLGGHALPVATVGSDAQDYLDRFEQLGIDTRHVRLYPELFTAQCFITSDLDDNQISAFHPGAMDRSADNVIADPKAAWAIVAPDSKAGMLAHVNQFAKAGIPFLFDLGQAMPLFDGQEMLAVFQRASALAFNDYEASVVEQRTGQTVQQLAQNLQAVIVTRGAQGSTLYTQGQSIDIAPIKPTAVVDPTGCGDAHRAGLMYGLTHGWDWEKSCMLGNVMGAIKIAHKGPQNHAPTRQEIARVMQQNFGVTL